MSGVLSLLSINIAGKAVSIVVFAFLARVLQAEHLAYIGLIPALSGMFLVVLSFGVGTYLEREVPKLRVSDTYAADSLLRTGIFVCLTSIPMMIALLASLSNFWPAVLLKGYTLSPGGIYWIILPIAGHMLLEISGWMLIIRGAVTEYGVVRVAGDLSAKTCALLIYFIYPGATSVFIGLSVGYMPFLLTVAWRQRKWLFGRLSFPVGRLLKASWVFYIESVFQMFRDRGDRLLVSSVLGPVAMASYYVARTIAAQLGVLFSPVSSVVIPRFSASMGKGKAALESSFSRVWTIAPPVFLWLASMVAAVSPFLLGLIAGPEYANVWQTATILCYSAAAMSSYAVSSRILLVMGSSMDRFRAVLVHTGLLIVAVSIVGGSFGADGFAFSWLVAGILTNLYVKRRSRAIGFNWARSRSLAIAIALSIPIPALCLYIFDFERHGSYWLVPMAMAMGSVAMGGMLMLQSAEERQQLLDALPKRLSGPLEHMPRIRANG